MTDALRLVIAAGGTGGHLFPALAVAQALRRTVPSSNVLFVGANQGLEAEIVPRYGFELRRLASGKLKGTGWSERLRTIAGLTPTVLRAGALLGELRADLVLGAGGYASAPVVLAAALRRIPVLLLEQNAVPGLTTRLLARFATRVVTAFPDPQRLLPANRTMLLGNPLRLELVEKLDECAAARVATRRPARLLVLGGSQGARPVNRLLIGALPRLRERLGQFVAVHQTGPEDLDEVRGAYRAAGIEARVERFIENMASAYCEADLMIGRSGATTLAELAVAALPALLIPYPHAADDHQAANAAHFAAAGAAVMARQETLDGPGLANLVGGLIEDPDALRLMARGMRSLARPRAAAAVVDVLLELAPAP